MAPVVTPRLRRLLVATAVSLSLACGSQGAATAGQAPEPAPLGSAKTGELLLPQKQDSLRIAVIGDAGTGSASQRAVAERLTWYHARYPFTLVLMLGDNMYGSEKPSDYKAKFEEPYAALLAAGVKFYAALGNHDNPNQRFYEAFNMGGKRYYSFKPKQGVRFFALDSNYLDPEQLAWLEKELASSGSDWKIAFFHHPLYSSGDKHGPALEKREVLEPILLKHGVRVVFTGHEHFYERTKPQKGIYHFISGAAAKLRSGGNVSEITARGFDDDYHFMLVEIAGDELYFQTITPSGRTVDSGAVARSGDKPAQEEAAGGK